MFSIVTTKEEKLWAQFNARLAKPDVHFTPGYACVQEVMGGQALLAVYTYGGNFVMQPFIQHHIPRSFQFDWASLYGFGGPISNATDHQVLVSLGLEFESALRRHAIDNGIVAEFCALHPLMASQQRSILFGHTLKRIKDVVAIDLTMFTEADYARRVRRGIASAKDEGVVVTREGRDMVPLFSALYTISMHRKNAPKRFHFPIEYFAAHFELPGIDTDIFLAKIKGTAHRALMVIGYDKTAYAHFLGSTNEHRHTGIDEMLYHEAAQSLRERGYELFHLGGGRTNDPNDSLLAFKSGFSSLRFPVSRYERVYQPSEYDLLVERWRKEGGGHVASSTFFPAYRAEDE